MQRAACTQDDCYFGLAIEARRDETSGKGPGQGSAGRADNYRAAIARARLSAGRKAPDLMPNCGNTWGTSTEFFQ